jgi:2-polyprenyl-6-methoxyphenol hydroxylase-like FAD-dependent oxidoreductase
MVDDKIKTGTQLNCQVLIVGAGTTGLALALWLTKLGVKIRIIDKNPEKETTTRALAVHARTLEFYRQIGMADELVQRGCQVSGVNLWTRGNKVMRILLDRMGENLSYFPYVLDLPQDTHETLLLEKLHSLGIQVERLTELTHFEQSHDGVKAFLKKPDKSEELLEIAYLAGCDGAHSIVRKGLSIGFSGGTYEGLFYVADVNISGLPPDKDIHIDLDDGDFIGIFPYKESNHVRLIGIAKPEGDSDEITFEGVQGRAIEHMRIKILQVNWFSAYRNHHRVADHFQKGRIFLLGDAGHIHSPVGGQGMNTGIGDAVNLAWKIAAVLNEGVNDSLLDTYEIERIPFARRLVATTDRMFTLITKRGAVAQFTRTRVLPLILPWLFRKSTVRRSAFRTISQIGIQYRKSPLSAGVAGIIHGGDRLPWVQTKEGEDNFMPLNSFKWQVHIYGEPRSDLSAVCTEFQLPLHIFHWQQQMQQAGLVRTALYLIRPDGYIALVDPNGDPQQLRNFVLKLGLPMHLK